MPVKVTAWELSGALSATVRVAVSPSAVVGSNSTLTVQVVPAATVALAQISALHLIDRVASLRASTDHRNSCFRNSLVRPLAR